MKNLNCLRDHILYQTFKMILSISSKKHVKMIDNPPITIYVKKTENKDYIGLSLKSNQGIEQ